MLWHHFRREVTHCELFVTMAAVVTAAYDFFHRDNQTPQRVLSVIGAHPT
jgi:putative transposase